jgi:tRNA pseudouridine55 synthase
MDGLLVVDKPAGPTSHDVVARVRRALREQRIGHTGTLDPAATGVLCLVLGRATRLARFLSASDKSYDAVVRFGFFTDTADAQGRAIESPAPGAMPDRDAIDAALDAFRGTFLQQPPAFSAKKIGGTRSHRLARERARHAEPALPADGGDPATRAVPDPPALPAAVTVTARSITIVGSDADSVTLRVVCSAGFYVRSLAHDLGARLGIGAHLASLRRTRSGDFALDRAIPLDAIERDPAHAAAAIVPMRDLLPAFPAFVLTAEGVKRAVNGCALGPRDSVTGSSPIPDPDSPVRLLAPSGELVAIAVVRANPESRIPNPGSLHPSVVLM